MKYPVLRTKHLALRHMTLEDAHGPYISWMHDPEVLEYLEARHSRHSIESLREFISETLARDDAYLFAIVYQDRHIGNIKLGPIQPLYHRADIGLLIGEKSLWGKGFATEAIKCVTEFAFSTLGLHRLSAGCYSENQGSLKAFQKAGFRVEARLKDFWLYDNQWQDQIIMSCICEKQ